MAWTDGFELANGSGETVFAEHQNNQIMAQRGNYVISGLEVTEESTPVMGVDISDGEFYVAGSLVAISSFDTTALDALLVSDQASLTSGQSMFVIIYCVGASITRVAGSAATTGSQLPPDIPEGGAPLAQIILTFGDSTIDTADIEDWRILYPQYGVHEKLYILNQGAGGDPYFFSNDASQELELVGDLKLGDGKVLILGEGEDMKLSHNGTTAGTFITAGTFTWTSADNLIITLTTGDFTFGGGKVYNPADNEGYYTGGSNQSRFYFDGTNTVINTTTGIIDLKGGNVEVDAGNFTIPLGNSYYVGSGLRLFHSTDATINALSGDLVLQRGGTEAFRVDTGSILRNPVNDAGYWTGSASQTGIYYNNANNTSFIKYTNTLTFGGGDDEIKLTDSTLYFASNKAVTSVVAGFYMFSASDVSFIHNATNLRLTVGASAGDFEISYHNDFNIYARGSLYVYDANDSNATILHFGTQGSSRFVTWGGASDSVDMTVYGDLDPGTDNTFGLGTITKAWGSMYLDVNGLAPGGGDSPLYVDVGTSNVFYSTSIRASKTDFDKHGRDTSVIYDFDLFSFRNHDREARTIGYIAEDIAQIAPELATYDKEGELTSYASHLLPFYIIEEMKDLRDRITYLEKQLV